jgi:cell division protein FtsQ
MAGNKFTFRKILTIAVWLILGSGTVVLLVAAITKKNNEEIAGVKINITGVRDHYFIDKKDVLRILEKLNNQKLEKSVASSLNLGAMENTLLKDQWIKSAEIFFDNNNVLQIKIDEREPIARIFTTSGTSFYLDSSLKRLPLSDEYSARLPVFTNFPTEVAVLKKEDSVLLNDIKTIGQFISTNSFWMAQIDQVDITANRTFELIPKLGNQVIRFGNADNYNEKFNKLLAFYKQVQTRTGWNKYSIIDVQFKDQVVGVKRDAKEIKMDSLKAVQIMKAIIEDAQKRSSDSTNVQLTQPDDNNSNVNSSRAIEDAPGEAAAEVRSQKDVPAPSVAPARAVEKPVVKSNVSSGTGQPVTRPSVSKPAVAPVKKPVVKKVTPKKEEVKNTGNSDQKPKAVMPPKSDY